MAYNSSFLVLPEDILDQVKLINQAVSALNL